MKSHNERGHADDKRSWRGTLENTLVSRYGWRSLGQVKRELNDAVFRELLQNADDAEVSHEQTRRAMHRNPGG